MYHSVRMTTQIKEIQHCQYTMMKGSGRLVATMTGSTKTVMFDGRTNYDSHTWSRGTIYGAMFGPAGPLVA